MLRVRQQNLINIHRRSLRREQVTNWRHRDLINIHEMGVLNGRRLLILNNPGELSTAHRHASERKHCAFSSNTTTSLIYIYLERRILCTLNGTMSTVFCCFLLVFCSLALCMDFEERPSSWRSEHTMFQKSHKSRNLLTLSDLQHSDHVRMKRSEGSAQNQCHSLHGYESTLQNNTHTVGDGCTFFGCCLQLCLLILEYHAALLIWMTNC